MSTQPLCGISFREFDANGAPLAGGKLYTYAAGTTTPQATYTDASGGTPNANPVVLDSTGRADVWMTPGLLYKFVLDDSAGNLLKSVDNFPAPAAQSTGSTSAAVYEPGGRLTLTSGTPVTTADVTGATSVFYSPYKSSLVPLFDGTNWALWDIGAGLSQATTDNTKSPAAVVANSLYDMFVWNDSGTLRCTRGPPWTSDTTRSTGVGTTELVQQNGRNVNKNAIANGPGALLGLYVGTVRSDASLHINDSLAKRHCWNAYGRVPRAMSVSDAATTWSYSTATVRQANANAANQLDYLSGLSEDRLSVRVVGMCVNSTSTGRTVIVGIGIDSTTALAAGSLAAGVAVVGNDTAMAASYVGYPGKGRHVATWLEMGNGTDTQTWFGTTGGALPYLCGIQGEIPA